MSETEIVKPPKRERKPKEIAEIAPAPTVRLGSVPITNPGEMVAKATEYANVLADIIIKQELFKVIQNKRYVLCEGWTTLGAMLGVVPVEESCEALPDGHGYVAKVSLIRTSDGQTIGGASAECTKDEPTWKSRSSYALRSMSITRATGKAFRLSFSWIMKLAGFEPTPAEEMNEDRGTKEAAQEVAKRKIAEHEAKSRPETAKCLFYTIPDEHNGHRAYLVNVKEYGSTLNEVAAEGLRTLLKRYCRIDSKGEVWVADDQLQDLIDALKACEVPIHQLKANG
jgi:hypothetical protein